MALDLPSYLLGKKNGGGGGGTSDYSQLSNKPSINGITLSGNKTSADLGIESGISYLGDISQYSTQQTALDISNLEKGFYYFTTTDVWLSNTASRTIYLIVNGTTKEVKLSNLGASPTLGMWTLQILNKASGVGSTYPYYIARIFTSWVGNVAKEIGNEVKTIYYAANNMIIVDDDTRKLEKVMTLNTAETVTAKKTFDTLPESSVVPTTDNQLVNKKYVDDIVGDISTVLATLTTPGGE